MSNLKEHLSKIQILVLVLGIVTATFSACIQKKNLSQHRTKINLFGGKGGDGGHAENGKNGVAGKDGKSGGVNIKIKEQ